MDSNFLNECENYKNEVLFIGKAIAFLTKAIAFPIQVTLFTKNEVAFSVVEPVCVKILFAFSVFSIAFLINEVLSSILTIAIAGFEGMIFE